MKPEASAELAEFFARFQSLATTAERLKLDAWALGAEMLGWMRSLRTDSVEEAEKIAQAAETLRRGILELTGGTLQ